MMKVTINVRKKINKKMRVIESIDKVVLDLDHAKRYAQTQVERYGGDDYLLRDVDGKHIRLT